MPVYKLVEEMPYTELINWLSFFNRRPIGWREDQRTYMILRSQGVKEKAESLFPTLKQMAIAKEAQQENDKAVPKGKFLELMLKAKEGDGWKPNFKTND